MPTLNWLKEFCQCIFTNMLNWFRNLFYSTVDTIRICIPFFQRILRLASFLVLITVGLPIAWIHLPENIRPDNVWDFLNSVLLIYIAVKITFEKNECWLKNE